MPWYFFLGVSIVVFSINSILSRSIMKQARSDPFAQMIALFGLGSIFMFVLSISLHQFQLPPSSVMGYFLFGAFAAVIGSYLINSAYKLLEASEVTILSSSQRLWSVLAAFIFLAEPFSYLKISATLIIIVGVVIASWKHHTLKWDKGALFVVIAAILFSSADIAGYHILNVMNPVSFIAFSYLLPILIIIPIRPKTIKHLKFYFTPRNGIMILVASVFDTIGYFSYNNAYLLSHNASRMAPLTGTRIVFTVILGYIFLKERDNMKKKLIGAGIIIAGSSLLFI